ncbi:unnamed protein product, partial [Ixodes persulcatus]
FKADAFSVTEKSPLLPQRPAQQWTSPVPSSIDPDLVGGSSSGTPDLKTQEAGHRRLLLAVTAAMMATMSYGLSVGYTSPALPDIRQRMDLSDDQSDWFGSLLNIGGIFGALAGGKLIRFIGRKFTLLLATAVSVAGWLCIVSGTVPGVLFFGRALTGAFMGMTSITAPVFVSEVSPKNIRGLLNVMCSMSYSVGVLLAYTMGKWLHYDWLAAASMTPPVLMALILPWLADSPRWLFQVGRDEDALRAIHFYGRSDADEEYKAMRANVDTTERFQLSELKQPYIYMPFMMTLLALFLQQFSGIAVLLLYTYDIFTLAGWKLSAADSSIVVGTVPLVGIALAVVLTDRIGRRILFLFSLAVSAVSLATLGTFYHLKQIRDASFVEAFGWLPLASLCVFFLGFSVGLRPLPPILMGELLPIRIKGFASGILMCFFFSCATFTTKEYHPMMTFFGQGGIYWFYASFMVAGFVLVMVFLPETKGKSLEDIETIFGK